MEREAIILAGGLGTRLSHVVSDVPKPMAPVGNRPFLDYLLDRLAATNFTHVVLSTGHMHNVIENHYGTHYGNLSLSYAHEPQPLGTGGALRFALQQTTADKVLTLNGDTYFDIDYNQLYSINNTPLALVLRRVDDTSRYGAVEFNTDCCVTAFREKEPDNHSAGYINGGIYLIDRHLLDSHPVGERFSFETEVLQNIYTTQPVRVMPSDDYFIDIGVPDDYRRAQQELPALLANKHHQQKSNINTQ